MEVSNEVTVKDKCTIKYVSLCLIILYFRHNKQIDDLYKFLIEQDPETAALAHNAMLCGLAKCFRV